MSETVRAYFNRTTVIGDPAHDTLIARRGRWCALLIDGRPFGDHVVSEPHFEEKASLAMVLVSCNVDNEVLSLHRLPERHYVHTPDFEAQLAGSRTVRIEVTQFNDEHAMTYQNKWNAVFTIVQRRRAEDPLLSEHLRGLHVVFEFPRASPPFHIANEVADELLGVLRGLDRAVTGCWMLISDTFAALHQCGGAYKVTADRDSDSTVQFMLPLGISNTEGILASVPVRLAAKAAKYPGYSDGGVLPVWLAVFARDEAAGFNLSAIQELGNSAKSIAVEPFERLLIANMVAGLLVESDRSKPAVYSSLTVPRLDLARS